MLIHRSHGGNVDREETKAWRFNRTWKNIFIYLFLLWNRLSQCLSNPECVPLASLKMRQLASPTLWIYPDINLDFDSFVFSKFSKFIDLLFIAAQTLTFWTFAIKLGHSIQLRVYSVPHSQVCLVCTQLIYNLIWNTFEVNKLMMFVVVCDCVIKSEKKNYFNNNITSDNII